MGGANPKDSLGSCADMSNSSAKVPADAIGGAHDLARRGLFEELTALIDEKPESVHAVDDFGATPLYHSCYDGHLHIAAELLRRGADPNLVTQWKLSTSLHRACQGGHRSLVKLLLNSYADANKKDPLDGSTLLHTACQDQHIDIVELLLSEGGVDPNAKDQNGVTPIHFACLWGRKATVELLIERGATVHAPDDFGLTPLYKACANKRKDIAALLVERGANLSLGPACNRPPLVRAAEDGNDIYIHMLLDSEELRTGDDSKGDQSENAESALFAACKRGHAAVVRSLVGYGADLNCVNDEGKTMLHVAAKEGPRGHGMLSALIQLGIDLDIIDKRHRTALYVSCARGDIAGVRVLCEAGADVAFCCFAKDDFKSKKVREHIETVSCQRSAAATNSS